jgi:hypothetical protein
VRACLIAPALMFALWMGACGIDGQLTNGLGHSSDDASSDATKDGGGGDSDEGSMCVSTVDAGCSHDNPCCSNLSCTAADLCETTCLDMGNGPCTSNGECCHGFFCSDAGACTCFAHDVACTDNNQCCGQQGQCIGRNDAGVGMCVSDSVSR